MQKEQQLPEGHQIRRVVIFFILANQQVITQAENKLSRQGVRADLIIAHEIGHSAARPGTGRHVIAGHSPSPRLAAQLS